MKIALVALLAAGLIATGAILAYLEPAHSYSDEELRAFGFTSYPQPRQIPAFALTDASGGDFLPQRLQGRWSLLFFGYANCPDICPITLSILGNAEALLEKAEQETFQGVMVSVDPERDTPQALAQYVAAFSDRFVGVTGDVAALEAFAKSLHAGFVKVPTEDSALGYLMDHSSHLAVIDPAGRHYGFIRPPLDAAKIATLIAGLARRWELEEQPPA